MSQYRLCITVEARTALQRTAGLYYVTDGNYQVRGFDLANMTIVRIPKTNGIIIIDCLTSTETMLRAIDLYQQEHREYNGGKDADIIALLYAHCHVDDFGGVEAITKTAKDQGRTLRILGPDGFLEHAVSENVYAEVNFYFHEYRALCTAENATHTLHNIQTLRGAPVRDARLWSRYLDETITLFGDKTDVVFASHHWPTWNEDEQLVVNFLSERDYYAYIHNESLRQLNDGQTPLEIAETIQIPPTLSGKMNLQGYYGSISHNVKAVHDRYMDCFDGNPAYLWPLVPTEEVTEFVKFMGGSDAVFALAQGYYTNKKLRFAATLLDKLVFATQSNPDEKDTDANQAKELWLQCTRIWDTALRMGHGLISILPEPKNSNMGL